MSFARRLVAGWPCLSVDAKALFVLLGLHVVSMGGIDACAKGVGNLGKVGLHVRGHALGFEPDTAVGLVADQP